MPSDAAGDIGEDNSCVRRQQGATACTLKIAIGDTLVGSGRGPMPNFCFRLLFRLGIVIDSDEQAVDISTKLCAHPLQLMARAPTIRTSRKLAIRSCGYGSEDEARQSGTRVLNAMLLGGLIQRLGVDFGTGRRGPQFAQAIRDDIAKTGATLHDEVEGLDVYEGLDTIFFCISGRGNRIESRSRCGARAN